jgi:hypothetical protein
VVDVFEQVEEEIRSERYKRMAKTWLPVVGAVLLVLLIGALAWWGWQSWQTSKAGTASVAYQRGLEALEQNDNTAADAAFVEAAEAGSGAYASMALQHRAGLALQANQPAQALALFDEAAEAHGDPVLADPARLKAAYVGMDTGMNIAELETRLAPLAEEGRPLRPFAQQALGMARLQAGQTQPARDAFVQLTLGQDVPDIIRQQAQAAISAIDAGTAAGITAILQAQAALPQPSAQGAAPQQAPAQTAPAQPAPAPAPAPAAAPAQ